MQGLEAFNLNNPKTLIMTTPQNTAEAGYQERCRTSREGFATARAPYNPDGSLREEPAAPVLPKYRKGTLEAKLDSLLPDWPSFDVIAYELGGAMVMVATASTIPGTWPAAVTGRKRFPTSGIAGRFTRSTTNPKRACRTFPMTRATKRARACFPPATLLPRSATPATNNSL